MTEELAIYILDMTNQKLQAFINSHPTFISKRYFQPISLTELYAFFGLMIEIGAYVFFANHSVIFIVKT